VTSDTSADGEGWMCERNSEEKGGFGFNKFSCNSWDQLITCRFPARASVRGRRVLAIPD